MQSFTTDGRVEALETETEGLMLEELSEPIAVVHLQPRRRWVKKAALGGAGVLLLAAAAFASMAAPNRAFAAKQHTGELVEGKAEIEVAPPPDQCSKPGEYCSKCCAVTGYKCYAKNQIYNGCLREGKCDKSKGWTCARPASSYVMKQAAPPPGTELYCFTVIVRDVGTPKKKPHDFSLVKTQLRVQASIFGCESHSVFSDVDEELSPGNPGPPVRTTVLPPVAHIGKRKTGAWVNSPTFHLAWQVIKEKGLYRGTNPDGSISDIVDWTVKVDPDAVFLPARLRLKLARQAVTPSGIYITNCRYVRYGFFGSLEVFSRKATEVLLENFDSCKSELAWTVPGKEFGEDLFAQKCMDRHGVDAIEDFSIANDGVCKGIEERSKKAKQMGVPWYTLKLIPLRGDCGADRESPVFHPYKKPEEHFTCLAETQQ